jgi:hypothetical protein
MTKADGELLGLIMTEPLVDKFSGEQKRFVATKAVVEAAY